jgi:hypothetical protein
VQVFNACETMWRSKEYLKETHKGFLVQFLFHYKYDAAALFTAKPGTASAHASGMLGRIEVFLRTGELPSGAHARLSPCAGPAEDGPYLIVGWNEEAELRIEDGISPGSDEVQVGGGGRRPPRPPPGGQAAEETPGTFSELPIRKKKNPLVGDGPLSDEYQSGTYADMSGLEQQRLAKGKGKSAGRPKSTVDAAAAAAGGAVRKAADALGEALEALKP